MRRITRTGAEVATQEPGVVMATRLGAEAATQEPGVTFLTRIGAEVAIFTPPIVGGQGHRRPMGARR